MHQKRPHVLGIDDGPFRKHQDGEVPIVGVVMEGATLVEGVALTSFPVDGAEATAFLADWVRGLRWMASLHAIVLGGITIAGLGVVDLRRLAGELDRPVLAVTRRETDGSDLAAALHAAGLSERMAVVERTPPAWRLERGLYVRAAGVEAAEAERLLRATLHKARLPEPLRVAHLIGAALVNGQSRGRV